MGRKKLASVVLVAMTWAMFASASGCSMCQSPYDYTGPMYGPNGERTGFNYRRGSILGGDMTQERVIQTQPAEDVTAPVEEQDVVPEDADQPKPDEESDTAEQTSAVEPISPSQLQFADQVEPEAVMGRRPELKFLR